MKIVNKKGEMAEALRFSSLKPGTIYREGNGLPPYLCYRTMVGTKRVLNLETSQTLTDLEASSLQLYEVEASLVLERI